MTNSECHGYKVLKIQLKAGSDSIHSIYLKEHKVRERIAEKPPDRTVFAIGIPPYATEESLKNAFSSFGKVEAVYIHSSPMSSLPSKPISSIFNDIPSIKGFKVAYIVFESSLGVNNALSMDSSTPLLLSTNEAPILLGLKKYCQEYNLSIINPSVMQEEIDNFMEEYDSKVEKQEKELKALTQEPDDEGWTVVTKKGRKPGFSRKESVSKNIMKREANKRSKKELLNFYRFQIRESKMNHLVKLREKFAEDKKKVALMKQSRKFRPF